jgi:uncharacterized protein YcbK (DUF882 family)
VTRSPGNHNHVVQTRLLAGTAVALRLFLLSSLLLYVAAGASYAEERGLTRFFRMGDGQIHIRNSHNGHEANVQMLKPDGSLNDRALIALDNIFKFTPNEQDKHVSLRLLFLLDYFSDMVAPGKVIDLESGYRNPEYNQALRKSGHIVAPTSTHMDAMAIDFSIKGVAGKNLWEAIKKEGCCGVGHYGGNTVHLDSGRPRFWEAATANVDSGVSDFNRRIYLSTQYDRYRSGEKVRLALSSVSDYPFGVKRVVGIVKDGGADDDRGIVSRIREEDECIPVTDRTGGRSLQIPLPQDLPGGGYRIRVEFCQVPFPQMPSQILSNPVEIVAD